MTHKAYAITGALSAVLLLSACSGDDEGTGSDLRQEITANTEITEAEGLDGLASFNLADPDQLTWDSRTFEDGVFTFTGLVFTPDDGEEAESVNIAELKIAAPRIGDDGTVLVDQMDLSGLTTNDEDAAFSIDRILIDRPGPGLSAMIADALQGRMGDDYEVESESASDFYFDAVSMTGLSIIDASDSGQMDIGEITVAGYNEDGLESMVMAGMRFAGEDEDSGPINFSLEEMRADGISPALTGFYQDIFSSMGDMDSMPDLPNFMNPINTYDSFTMRGLEVDGGGLIVDLPEMSASMTPQGSDYRATASMPRLYIGASEGPMGDQLMQGLSMLGYEDLTMSFASNAIVDEDGDRIRSVDDNYIQLDDGMRISFTQDISGYLAYMEAYNTVMQDAFASAGDGDVAALDEMNDPLSEGMMEAYNALSIHEFSLSIQDMSLLERALTAAAEQQGMTAEDLRVQAAGFVGMASMMAPPEVPRALITEMSAALTSFIQQGGTMTVSMQPAQPVSVETLIEQSESGSMDLDALGISASHEAP